MTNEDAIKFLENLKNDIGNPHYECLWHYAQAIDEICALLEEQEAVEMDLCNGEPFCPTCGSIVRSYYNFCVECGQKFKKDSEGHPIFAGDDGTGPQ